MSAQELDRITAFTHLAERRLRQRETAAMLGLCTRQVRRLSRAFAVQAPTGSRRRGWPSNRRLPAELR